MCRRLPAAQHRIRGARRVLLLNNVRPATLPRPAQQRR
jgi:hypothetical protein